MIKLAPSVLSADFTKLGEELNLLKKESVPYVHIDVMDGLFVPNISFGMPVIKSMRKASDLVFDVHLMIDRPERYIDEFANCGSDIINFHLEACENISQTIAKIKALGKKVGITIKPKTDVKDLIPYLDQIDLALIMSVEPGFGGQKFMPNSLPKLNACAEYISKNNLNCELEIDGGINIDNVKEVINAGANVIVAGSAIFAKPSPAEEIKKYHNIFSEFEG